ncbi:MAG: TetR/AcrR family transcriptional regulator [Aerococcus sp.]|nr:TetR/AcrR family transcriptional regulator [Aerococcus sp.]
MSNMQRQTKTLPKIKRAFIELIYAKGMDSLTVSDIARVAKINRGTFYLHYIDKYDLMEKLESQAIAELEDILNHDEAPHDQEDPVDFISYTAIYKALVYVKKEFDLVAALASEGGDPLFLDRIKEIIGQLVSNKLNQTQTLTLATHQFPEDYVRELLLAGTISIIERWIHKGGREDPETVARMIEQSKSLAPTDYIQVKN